MKQNPVSFESIELAKHDREQFEKLSDHVMKQYFVPMTKFFEHKCPGEDTEQLALDVIWSGLSKLQSFHGDSSFESYLWRSAANKFIDETRKKRGRGKMPNPDRVPLEDSTVHDQGRAAKMIETTVIVKEALDRLTADQQSLVCEHYFDGATVNELRVKHSNAKNQMSDAIRGLRKEADDDAL